MIERRLCSNQGDACVCENQIHERVAQEVKNIEKSTFDPLNLHQHRGKTLAVLLVSFIALGLISDQAFELAYGIELVR